MGKQVQRRRGTTTQHATFTGAVGEITVDTTKSTAVVHDGVTAGGHPLVRSDKLFVSVKEFGAVGDGNADDTAAIQAALNYIASLGDQTITLAKHQNGGTLYFPPGSYKTTAEITLPAGRIKICGSGRMTAYPGVFTPNTTSPSTIFGVHTDRNLFKIYNTKIAVCSYVFEDINVATLETGSRPTAAFGWDASGGFERDFTFNRVGVFGFTSGFDVYRSGAANNGAGVCKITDCCINRNTWIARNLDSVQWNSFKFIRNEAGQNGTVATSGGGLDVIGQSITIQDNLLEGQADTIKVSSTYRGLVITGNYFEANSGKYVIWLNGVNGAIVQGNFFGTITATDYIYVRYGANIYIDEVDIVPSVNGTINLQTKNDNITYYTDATLSQVYASCAYIFDPKFNRSKYTHDITELGDFSVGTSSKWMNGINDSVGNTFTTSGSGTGNRLPIISKTGLSIPSGNYVAVSILVSYDNNPSNLLAPYIDVSFNSGAGGAHTAQFYGHNILPAQLVGKSILYFIVLKTKQLVTTADISVYPFGTGAAAGLNCTASVAGVYDLGNATPGRINGTTSTVRDTFIPFIAPEQYQATSDYPRANNWQLGQKVWNYKPLTTEYMGWTCTRNVTLTLNGVISGTVSTITVNTTTVIVNDVVGVILDNLSVVWRSVTAVSTVGSVSTLTLSSSITGTAASGNIVYAIRWKGFGLVA